MLAMKVNFLRVWLWELNQLFITCASHMLNELAVTSLPLRRGKKDHSQNHAAQLASRVSPHMASGNSHNEIPQHCCDLVTSTPV